MCPSFIDIIHFLIVFSASQPHPSYQSANAWRGNMTPTLVSFQCISFLSRNLSQISAYLGNALMTF